MKCVVWVYEPSGDNHIDGKKVCMYKKKYVNRKVFTPNSLIPFIECQKTLGLHHLMFAIGNPPILPGEGLYHLRITTLFPGDLP